MVLGSETPGFGPEAEVDAGWRDEAVRTMTRRLQRREGSRVTREGSERRLCGSGKVNRLGSPGHSRKPGRFMLTLVKDCH